MQRQAVLHIYASKRCLVCISFRKWQIWYVIVHNDKKLLWVWLEHLPVERDILTLGRVKNNFSLHLFCYFFFFFLLFFCCLRDFFFVCCKLERFFFVFCLNIFSCLSFNDFRTKNSFTRLNLNWSTKNHRDGSENFTFTNGRQKMRPWRNKIRKKVTSEGHICERNYVNERKSWERKINGKSFGPSYHVCGVNGNT